MNNKKSVVWENVGGTVQVWIENICDERSMYYTQKDSNVAHGITIEEAQAIYNAFVYFINNGEIKVGEKGNAE